MGKFLILVLIFIIICMIWSLPLYLCVNFVLWVFNIPFHLSLLQSFAICLLIYVIKKLLFKNVHHSIKIDNVKINKGGD